MKISNLIVAGIDTDLGKGSAIVICRGTELLKYKIIKFFHYKSKPSKMERIYKIVDETINYILSLDKKIIPEFIGIESEAIRATGRYNTDKSRLLGLLVGSLYHEGFTIVEYPPKTIKAYAGNGKANPKEMVELVYENWGYKFLGPRGGKIDDLSDALCIAQLTLNHAGAVFHNEIHESVTEKQLETINNIMESSQFIWKDEQ